MVQGQRRQVCYEGEDVPVELVTHTRKPGWIGKIHDRPWGLSNHLDIQWLKTPINPESHKPNSLPLMPQRYSLKDLQISKPMDENDSEEWLTAFSRVRGGLHDVGLSLSSSEVIKWVTEAHRRLYGEIPDGRQPSIVDLPVKAVAKFADAIERKGFDLFTKRENAA